MLQSADSKVMHLLTQMHRPPVNSLFKKSTSKELWRLMHKTQPGDFVGWDLDGQEVWHDDSDSDDIDDAEQQLDHGALPLLINHPWGFS